MGIFDSSSIKKARDKELDTWKRKEALGKVNDQGLLAQIARDSTYADVCTEAFSKAFDQLADDHELCCKVVHDCIALIKEGLPRIIHSCVYGRDNTLGLLMRIADHHPDLIRQFWPQIKSACHEDDLRCAHEWGCCCDRSYRLRVKPAMTKVGS